MGHDVFISYSSLDKPAADAVCHGLEAKGIRCWIAPRDQVAGQPFGQQITAAISAAQVMVLVFSDNVNKSHAVHNEVGIAANANVTIVPFRIAGVDFNSELNFYLGRMHWLDAFPQSVDHYIDNLAATVQRNITRTTAGSANSTPPPGAAPPAGASAAPLPQPPAAPRRRIGVWSWLGIIVGALAVVVVADHVLRREGPAGIRPTTIRSDDGTTVTIGAGGVSVVDANSLAAPSAPPKPGSPPNASAVRYYETVLVPGGPPGDLEDASVIGTVKLAQRLQERAAGKRSFIAIDTRGCSAGPSIPGSFCLDPTTIKELQAKVPDRDTGLILFCDDGRCPSAYALAQQAVAVGYGSVDWYRGGVNAWISSGGPVAPVTPTAK